jgi:AcrR family transcriptional regulator/DNA-binding MarR family transcriptional regulator
MQRARLLGAAVSVVDEFGWSRAVTTNVCARARISRRTFYDLFEDREDCLLAVLQEAVARVEGELEAVGVAGLSWRERVRMGLWVVLCFFDREPALARVCVVQSARGGRRVLEYREELLARLVAVIAEGSGEGSRSRGVPPLVAEGLAGAVVSILYTRLLKGEEGALSDLLGELTGLIVLPYLGPAVAGRERSRPAPTPEPRVSGETPSGVHLGLGLDPLRDVSMRLTYRTALVLEVVAEYPGVSNRLVAERAEISDQGQVSKLLARLERLGLLENTGEGQPKEAANAWTLTPTGVRVTQSIRSRVRRSERVA